MSSLRELSDVDNATFALIMRMVWQICHDRFVTHGTTDPLH